MITRTIFNTNFLKYFFVFTCFVYDKIGIINGSMITNGNVFKMQQFILLIQYS